ncbi:MAG: hypothetical protein GXC76_07360 [Rhodanobacteraceae bacterium]|jgi:hypothetical protein|nr:hypothetical protein [Rhodanobacteraceae bacterium]
MDALKTADRIVHPAFGLGSVVSDEAKGMVEVVFDEGGNKKLLALKYAHLRKVDVDEELEIVQSQAASLKETFSFETEDNHSPGSHWSPFYEDPKEEVVKRLPEWLQGAGVALGLSSFETYRAPPLPGDWAKGFKLRWPETEDSIHFVLKQGDSANMLTTWFPVIARGTQESLEIRKVHVWESGVEAQIEASIGAASIRFFDTDFVINAGWYRAGAKAEFILAGLAYQCEPANEPDIVVDDHWPVTQFLRQSAIERGENPGEAPRTISYKGAAILLPIDEWDRDDYQFRGTILEVRPYVMLDVEAWLLTVCVMRCLDDNDRELHLNILVTRRVWSQLVGPAVGDDVRGALWLQGRLWSPPSRSS